MIDLPALRRRTFLTGTLGSVAAIGLAGRAGSAAAQEAGPLPDYIAWKDADALIVHSDKTVEMKRTEFGTSLITPEDKLYIRNNINPPSETIIADRDAWQVSFGGVRQPGALTVGELKTLGLTTVATVLQCSGNGRKYFMDMLTGEESISGTPWTVGAAGCVIWSGVSLKAVVDALGGVAEGVRFVTGTGGEELPEGLDPKELIVERSVPIEMLEHIVLAWEMNGTPLPFAHGGPLRMIVPGYSGVNNIKYVKSVALTETESDAKIQSTSYRYHALGEKGSPEDPSVWAQPVKSWITTPLEMTNPGRAQIAGVAFGGMNAVAKVEVTTDGGATWREASFVGPDLGRFAWRNFVLSADLEPGSYVLASRATDVEGNVQPETNEINGSGYSYNGWAGPAIALTIG